MIIVYLYEAIIINEQIKYMKSWVSFELTSWRSFALWFDFVSFEMTSREIIFSKKYCLMITSVAWTSRRWVSSTWKKLVLISIQSRKTRFQSLLLVKDYTFVFFDNERFCLRLRSHIQHLFKCVRSKFIALIATSIRHCLTKYQEDVKRNMLKFESDFVESMQFKIKTLIRYIVNAKQLDSKL